MSRATFEAGEEIKVGDLTWIGSDGKIYYRPAAQHIAEMHLFPISDTEFTSVSDGDPPVAFVTFNAHSNTPVGREIFDLKFKVAIGLITIHNYDAITGEHRFTAVPTKGDSVLPKSLWGMKIPEAAIGHVEIGLLSTAPSDTYTTASHTSPVTLESMRQMCEQIKAMPPIADLNLSDEQIRRIQIEMSKPEKLQLGQPTSEMRIEIAQSSRLYPLVQWLADRFTMYEQAQICGPSLTEIVAHLEQIMPLSTTEPAYGESPISKIWDVWTNKQAMQESARNYFAGSLPTDIQKLREHFGTALPPATCHLPPGSDEPIIK